MKISSRFYQKSKERALAYSNTLTADDPCFNRVVHIVHEDGSMWLLRNAFSVTDAEDTDYVWIITEHFDELVFEHEEVTVTEMEILT